MSENVLAPEVFDRLQQAMAEDQEGLADLYREYLADASRVLRELRNALLQQDAETLRRQAHYLKGSSQVVGVRVVASGCAALEDMGSRADFSDADRVLGNTASALLSAQEELARRLGTFVIPADESAAS